MTKAPPRASTTATTAPTQLPSDWNESTSVADKLRWLHATYKSPPKEHLGLLPKPTSKENQKGNCSVCDGWHGLPAVHLDYLGHAELTDILLFVDPEWAWAPFALDPDGQPKVISNDKGAVMWITLTIWGVTRIGVGTSPPKGPDTYKELIGDALRNAGMRFGIAVDLWSKAEGIDRKMEAGQAIESDADHDPNAQPGPEDTPQPATRRATNEKKPEPNVWTYDGLVDLGLRTLNDMCRKRDLPCTGKVADYAERLMDWQAKNATPTSTTTDIPDDPTVEPEPAGDPATDTPSGDDTPGEPADPDPVAAADDAPDSADEEDEDDGDEWANATADEASVAAIVEDIRKLKGSAKTRAYAAFRKQREIPAKPEVWTNAQLEEVIAFLDRLEAPVSA